MRRHKMRAMRTAVLLALLALAAAAPRLAATDAASSDGTYSLGGDTMSAQPRAVVASVATAAARITDELPMSTSLAPEAAPEDAAAEVRPACASLRPRATLHAASSR